MANTKIKILRGLKKDLPLLDRGEIAFCTDTEELFAGDGEKNILLSGGGGGEVDLNAMAYFDYAGRIYGDKYSLLKNAWEHSLTVDPLEISQNSSYDSPRGTAQYPNGETEGVIIPQGVTSIGDYAFYSWWSNNQPLVIPNSVIEIGLHAFEDWRSNNQSLTIPNSVTSIGKDAFRRWEANNQPLVIPDSVTSIGESAFEGWSSNNQPLTIPNSVINIGDTAFVSWSSNNQPLVIPNSVASIGTSAFYNWSSNNQPLVIPNSVASINYAAFAGWSSNNHPLVIPNSVTSIGSSAFRNWSLVPYVEIQAITPPSLVNANAFEAQNNAPIYVPDESVDDYKTATNWVDLADRIFPISDKLVGGYININYADLVTLRDSNNLKKGAFYRITDYETTTVQTDTRSAGHLFDIIVQALDEKTLSENAQAIHSERDVNGYFDGVKLEAWELKYCLDNDTDRFAWADEVNGKGVIYYMKDEYNNEVPYDFKNIQFKRDSFYDSDNDITFDDIYFYTFSAYSFGLADGAQGDIEDATIIAKQEGIDDAYNQCHSNVIKPAHSGRYDGTIDTPTWGLHNNILVNRYKSGDIYFQCFNNTIGFDCTDNTIGNNFYYNTIGNYFRNNTIGNDFYYNTIGNRFYYNTIGNYFYYNTIGNYFRNNTIGNDFYSNTIGNNFYYNTIGNDFYYNTIGNRFYYNTIGNGFNSNTIGNESRNNTIGNYFYNNTIGNSVQYIQFSLDGTYGNQIRYLYLKDGLRGASSANRLDLYYDGLYGREYPTTFEIIANGNVISSWEETPLTRAGKVKATKTTATWSDI